MNWFLIDFFGMGKVDLERLYDLYLELPNEEYKKQFLEYIKKILNEYNEIDGIGEFYQFVLDEAKYFLEDRDINVEEYGLKVWKNNLDSKYDINPEDEEKLIKDIKNNELDKFEIVELFLKILEGDI